MVFNKMDIYYFIVENIDKIFYIHLYIRKHLEYFRKQNEYYWKHIHKYIYYCIYNNKYL